MQARCCPKRLEMGGVDYQLIRHASLGRQFGKHPVKYALAAPADEAIVDRLVRAVTGRHITPAQPVPVHEDKAAHDPPIINPRNAVRQRKMGLNPAHLRLAQQPQLRQRQHLPGAAIESTDCRQRKQFNGSWA